MITSIADGSLCVAVARLLVGLAPLGLKVRPACGLFQVPLISMKLMEPKMPNEHIEFWKRFAAAYMEWVHFNFDRIVAEVIKKHTGDVGSPIQPDNSIPRKA